jgi:PIH1 N-terminal domain
MDRNTLFHIVKERSLPTAGAMPDVRLPGEVIDGAAGNDPAMKEQAQQIWSMLDDLMARDPAAYSAFIANTLKEAQEEAKSGGGGGKSFVPDVGFARLVSTVPRRIRTGEGRVTGGGGWGEGRLELAVNVVGHAACECPTLPTGRPVLRTRAREAPWDEEPDARRELASLTVPISVGKPRKLTAKDDDRRHAVDVVVHPWVLSVAATSRAFQDDVAGLAIHWALEELGLERVADDPIRPPPDGAPYVGGRQDHDGRLRAARWFLDEDKEKAGSSEGAAAAAPRTATLASAAAAAGGGGSSIAAATTAASAASAATAVKAATAAPRIEEVLDLAPSWQRKDERTLTLTLTLPIGTCCSYAQVGLVSW